MIVIARFMKRSIHMGRVVPEVDPNLAQSIIGNEINLKRVPTRRNLGLNRLPAKLQFAAEAKLRKFADSKFRKEVRALAGLMKRIKLPDDRDTLELKRADIKTELEIRDKLVHLDSKQDEVVLQEDQILVNEELKELIKGTVQDRRRDWHYYEYDEYATNLYMATRLPPNYACIKSVMNEILLSDPSFEPKSVLDFGSGMGTTIWAVNSTWPNSVNEFMNIDISKEQQYLCEYLLRGGRESGAPLDGIFHRQYLPSSTKTKYDMVVAAFSLLELPNFESRAQCIESLWQKTNDLLVIIERGNKGGFTIINEARHFILDLTGHDVTKKIKLTSESKPIFKLDIPRSHVLAPCAHEFACPRAQMSNKKQMDVCRFRVVFEPLDCGEQKSGFTREEFSYVILRKKPHPIYTHQNNIRWPRIVEKRKRSSGQITHKLCCPNGCLAETTITKSKYGKPTFEVAKSTDWGDILPVKIHDHYKSRSDK